MEVLKNEKVDEGIDLVNSSSEEIPEEKNQRDDDPPEEADPATWLIKFN